MDFLSINNIEKLHANNLSIHLVKKIALIIESLPINEEHIKDQLKRASTSIILNISKGEQIYPKNKFKYYSIARGSAQESNSWLLICLGKKLISEEEYLLLKSMIDKIINILTENLENLIKNYPNINFPIVQCKNINEIRSFQLAQKLVIELFEMDNSNFGEFSRYIQDRLVNAASNIASHISESEQNYYGRKTSFLNQAFQETNVLVTYIQLIESDIENEKYLHLKEVIAEIQQLISNELKEINSDFKCFI